MTDDQLKEIEEYAEARMRVGDVACAHLFLLSTELRKARAEIERLKANQTDAWNRMVRHSIGLNSAVLSLANLRDHVSSIVDQLEPDPNYGQAK